MNISEIHRAFKIELDKTSSLELPSFEPEEIDYWINRGIKSFVENKARTFYISNKLDSSINTLVVRSVIPNNNTLIDNITEFKAKYDGIDKYKSVLYYKPDDLYFILNESVDIYYKKLGNTYSSILSISDTISLNVDYLVIQSDLEDTPKSPVDSDALRYLVYDGKYYKASTVFTGVSGSTTLTTLNGGLDVVVSPDIKTVPVEPIDVNDLESILNNPYSEHILHYEYAKPLRVIRDIYSYDGGSGTDTRIIIGGEYIELITDGTYGLGNYYLTYIKRPRRFNSLTTSGISSGSNSIEEGLRYLVVTGAITYNSTVYNPGDVFYGVRDVDDFTTSAGGTVTILEMNTELPGIVHHEIVKLAVKMALENIEQPRYSTYSDLKNTEE